MVKLTTFLPFLFASLLYLGSWSRLARARLAQGSSWIAAVLLLPLACGWSWTEYTDSLKKGNPLAADFITSAALTKWNFGTVAQRLSTQPWSTMWNRTIPDLVGHVAVLALALLLVLGTRRRRGLFAVSLALFASAPLTFTNLHVVHSYYPYANGLFLIAAIGWSVVGSLERGGPWRWLGAALLICGLAASVSRYQLLYVPVQRANVVRLLDSAALLQSSTSPDDTALILGLDWNSELPYYARRRALMNRDGRPPDDPLMQRAVANLGARGVAALVACAGAVGQRSLIASWLTATGLSPTPRRTVDCEVYTRGG